MNKPDIEAIRQSPRQYVDLETVEELSDYAMVLEQQLAEKDALLRQARNILVNGSQPTPSYEKGLVALVSAINEEMNPDNAAEELEQQLTTAQKQIVMLRESLEIANIGMCGVGTLVVPDHTGREEIEMSKDDQVAELTERLATKEAELLQAKGVVASAIAGYELIEKQLAEREKQNVMLRGAISAHLLHHEKSCVYLDAAFDATADLSGYILCDAEPVCFIPADAIDQLAPPRIRLLSVPLITYDGEGHVPLYKARKI